MKYNISDNKQVEICHSGQNIEVRENHPLHPGMIYINTYTEKELAGLRDLITKFLSGNN